MKIPNALVMFVALLTLAVIACGSPITPTPTPAPDITTPTSPPALATLFPTWTPAETGTPTATVACTGCGLRGQP